MFEVCGLLFAPLIGSTMGFVGRKNSILIGYSLMVMFLQYFKFFY
jgi:hypothetical protein